jgi:hypothetical protein
MNLIQKQANEFCRFKLDGHGKHKEFINDVRMELYEYKKVPHKIEFIETIIVKAKTAYDEHLPVCSNKDKCTINDYYENTLFFLQEELEDLEGQLGTEDFSKSEKIELNLALQKIITDLDQIKLGQQITYNDLQTAFEEMKDLYYLNKKTWKQLFVGKLSEMVAGSVISETVGKDLGETVNKYYDQLIK